jgi:hypothetical protein
MTHPADEGDEINPPFSSPCSAPPIEEITPPVQQQQPIDPPQPANENSENKAQPPTPYPVEEKNFDSQAQDSFRMALGPMALGPMALGSNVMALAPNVESVSGFYAAASETVEKATQAMQASAEQFASGVTALNWKLLEFGRANAQTHLDFVQGFAHIRSLRDLVDVQTSYVRAQCDTLTTQMHELRVLSTEIAGKTAEPFKEQIVRATQLGRMC